jgi:predicted permease
MRALSLDSISGTFIASLRSIGTAMTMASVGYYLHQTDSIGSEGKRALALLSQQITVPLFLFTKIIFCNQDWSDKTCPDVTQSIADVWMLLFWPIYVVGVGLLIGLIVAKATNTPKHHVRSVLAACAFGNSTGLPITLLNVIHSNFPSTSDLGRIDPTLFLSVFLLLYPILLWGLGGWLLAPDDKENSVHAAPPPVLNEVRRRRLSSADEGLYLSEQ